jgi:hypothetical protein
VRPFTEWLRYDPGMFFQKHQDFERYICNGMVPYVCLIGLQDTEKGGETMVGEQVCHGSCRENGVVFFPSNLPHQAKTVIRGRKTCLKMEMQVFFSPEDGFVRVSDKDRQWLSFWSKKELELVDNYIRSHRQFMDTPHHKKSTDIQTSTETAREIHNMMLRIAEPTSKTPRVTEEAQDKIFPTCTVSFLHDIFAYYHFKQQNPSVFFGSDAKAWDFMNQEMDLPSHHTLLVGLWYKEEKDEPYRLSSLWDRACHKMDNYFPTVVEEMDTYMDYDSICAMILEEFTIRKDIQLTACSTSPPEKIQKKGRKTPCVVQPWRDLVKPYKPSEDGKYIKKSGVQTESVSEMCNDDMNSESWEYRRYVSFFIKIRWLVVVVVSE